MGRKQEERKLLEIIIKENLKLYIRMHTVIVSNNNNVMKKLYYVCFYIIPFCVQFFFFVTHIIPHI